MKREWLCAAEMKDRFFGEGFLRWAFLLPVCWWKNHLLRRTDIYLDGERYVCDRCWRSLWVSP